MHSLLHTNIVKDELAFGDRIEAGVVLKPFARAVAGGFSRRKTLAKARTSVYRVKVCYLGDPFERPSSSGGSLCRRVAVHFTLCLSDRRPFFVSEKRVEPHRDVLRQEVERGGCIAYVYCFMPDHLHAVLLGVRDDATPKKAIERFKQRSGFLLRGDSAHWQALYVLNNPLRAGLIENPLEYLFSGCIGTDYREMLETVL